MNPLDLVPLPYRLPAQLGAAALAVAAIAGAGAWGAHRLDAPARARAESRAAVAESALDARAKEAAAQRGLDASAFDAVSKAEHRAIDINLRGETAAHAVELAPGAPDVLPPDVLRSWAAGVDGVRDEARAARAAAAAAGPGAAGAARAVPAAGPA